MILPPLPTGKRKRRRCFKQTTRPSLSLRERGPILFVDREYLFSRPLCHCEPVRKLAWQSVSPVPRRGGHWPPGASPVPRRGGHWPPGICPVAHTVRRYRAFVLAVARAICPQAFGTNAICRRQIQPGHNPVSPPPGVRILRFAQNDKRGTPSRGTHCAPLQGFAFAVARAICPQAFGTNAICRRQIQPCFDNAPGNVPTSRFPFYAVGASIARPAFGTNAICRRQIQPGPDNVPGWIALPGDCLLRKRGRPMTAPTAGANGEPGGQ